MNFDQLFGDHGSGLRPFHLCCFHLFSAPCTVLHDDDCHTQFGGTSTMSGCASFLTDTATTEKTLALTQATIVGHVVLLLRPGFVHHIRPAAPFSASRRKDSLQYKVVTCNILRWGLDFWSWRVMFIDTHVQPAQLGTRLVALRTRIT